MVPVQSQRVLFTCNNNSIKRHNHLHIHEKYAGIIFCWNVSFSLLQHFYLKVKAINTLCFLLHLLLRFLGGMSLLQQLCKPRDQMLLICVTLNKLGQPGVIASMNINVLPCGCQLDLGFYLVQFQPSILACSLQLQKKSTHSSSCSHVNCGSLQLFQSLRWLLSFLDKTHLYLTCRFHIVGEQVYRSALLLLFSDDGMNKRCLKCGILFYSITLLQICP